MRRVVVVAAALAIGCGSTAEDKRPRHHSDEDHVSVYSPPGWEVQRELGSLVLVADPGGEAARNTISIRTAPVEGAWTERRTRELVLPATEKVLAALPSAKVSPPVELEVGGRAAVAYDVSWVPQGKKTRYERRHVVVFANDHVYHVMHTGPAAQFAKGKKVFDAVLASLEEG
jgi:hypothetical protein